MGSVVKSLCNKITNLLLYITKKTYLLLNCSRYNNNSKSFS